MNFDLICKEDSADYCTFLFRLGDTTSGQLSPLTPNPLYSSCHFKRQMLCPVAVQSLRPLSALYFFHSGLSWAVLSLSSNEHISEDYLSYLSWAATLPR